MVLPKRLWTLVQFYWKPVKSMLEYDPSKVDDKWWNVWRIYYVGENVKQKNFEWTIYSDYETAEKLRDENTRKAIWRIMQEKWYTIKEFEKKDDKIKELEWQIEELKNLPPIEIEKIENKFDETQNENLTIQRKRGRSNWEK